MVIFETANLAIHDDGLVFLNLPEDEYGERESKCLGDVETFWHRVPLQYQSEVEELEEAWAEYDMECSDYESGVMHDYHSTRGF